MTDQKRNIDSLLNKSVPRRPVSPEEAQKRLSSLSARTPEITPEEQSDSNLVTTADVFMMNRMAANEATDKPKARQRPMMVTEQQDGPLDDVSMADLEAWRKVALESMGKIGSISTDDPSASVTAVLDGRGELHHVEIVPGWRRRLRTEGLESALTQAISAAYQEYQETWLSILAGAMTGSPHVRGPEPRQDPGAFRLSRTVEEFDAGDRHLVDMLHELDRHTESLQAAAAASQSREVDEGGVILAVSGGKITGIRLDRTWASAASSSEIADRINQAISSMKRTADDQKMTEIRSRIEEVAQSIRSM